MQAAAYSVHGDMPTRGELGTISFSQPGLDVLLKPAPGILVSSMTFARRITLDATLCPCPDEQWPFLESTLTAFRAGLLVCTQSRWLLAAIFCA